MELHRLIHCGDELLDHARNKNMIQPHDTSKMFWSHLSNPQSELLFVAIADEQGFSTEARSLFINLEAELEAYDWTDNENHISYINSLTALFDSSQTLTSAYERFLVGGTISVAKHSAEYWYSNYENYETFAQSKGKTPVKKKDHGKSIVLTDATTFAGGAAGTAAATAAAVVTGPGALVVAGFGALGTVGGSACASLTHGLFAAFGWLD